MPLKHLLLVLCLFTTLSPSLHAQPVAAPERLLIHNVRIFTLEDQQPFHGYLLVGQDGAISQMGAGLPPHGSTAQQSLDGRGQWLLPGFVSAHSHLWQSDFAGIAANENLEGWLAEIYGVVAPKLDARQLYALTCRGAANHLRNGITSAFNFTYTGADRSAEVDRQQLRAALDAGIRVVHGFNVRTINTDWTQEQARQRTQGFLAWANQQPEQGRYLGTMLAGAAAYTNASPEQAMVEARLMHEFGLRNQQHYLESPTQSAAERGRYSLLKQAGMVGPDLIFGHFIHSSPELLADAARAGVSMTWNPLSNGRLGSGMADVLSYRKAGMKVGMGVDGEASADRADPFENMRTGLYQVRASQQNASAMQAYEVLRLHTLGSAEVLGIDGQVGSLNIGKRADLLLLDPQAFRPYHDPYAALVFAAGVRDIRGVFVDGLPLAEPNACSEHSPDNRVAEEEHG